MKALAAVGATQADIAQFLQINELTLIRWKAENPLFCKALTTSAEKANQRVKASLYMRANGYTRVERRVAVTKEGGVVDYEEEVYYPPDSGSIKLWLMNRDAKNWREKQAVEVYTPEGKAVRTYAATSDELQQTYQARLAAAEEGVDTDSEAAGDLGRNRSAQHESDGDEGAMPLR